MSDPDKSENVLVKSEKREISYNLWILRYAQNDDITQNDDTTHNNKKTHRSGSAYLNNHY
jgi:hypothetical protein